MPTFDVEQLTRDYFPRIHRAALLLTGNPWDADDLAQETFLVLSREGSKFRGESSWYTWLYGILLNLERVKRRRAGIGREKLQVIWNEEYERNREHPPASAAVESAEWRKSLWGYVAQLAEGQRQALVLRFSESLSYEAIANIMECPLGTVKSRIFHGLIALRQLLQRENADTLLMPRFFGEDQSHAV
jgi:RNA polymerase sigma-70 factor, ECF subfamily